MPHKDDTAGRRIAVIIVTFNNYSHIDGCLHSLSTALSGYKARVFVVDNASSDGTTEYLQNPELPAKFSFHKLVLIFNDRNTGFTYAVNQGLRIADENYIILLNPDIILQPQVITTLVGSLSDNVGVAAPQLRFPDGRVQPSCRRFPRKRDVFFSVTGLAALFKNSSLFNGWKMPDFDHSCARSVDQPQGAFLLIRRDVLQQTGLLDERFPMFFSDVDWCYRAKQQGFEIVFNPQANVVHYKGASVYRKRLHMIVSSHRSFVDYFKKYDRTGIQRLLTWLIFLLLLITTLPRLLGATLFNNHHS
ncbi:MAG TPA: glycosyltransferase family 2 protein [bacterium]|nr:glycosyltransferase family 2 protein [bacterium]HPN42256.1 glycosyltransferase family 2 protein [bacterium]